jgi:hypothetical protein
VQEAQLPYFQSVFTRTQFKVFILTAYPVGDADWTDGMTAGEIASVKGKFYDFARHLFTTQAYAGKTFVLQNWEGDNAMERIFTPTRNQGMIDWLNARQDGITQARNEAGANSSVKVYGAVESNLVDDARIGVADRFAGVIVPFTHADLYSYSAYDHLNNPARLRANLEFLRQRAPDSTTFGADNVMLGEIAVPQNREDVQTAQRQRDYTHALIRSAVNWGARYVAYWLRDNAGNRPPVWQFFRDSFVSGVFPTAVPTPPPGPASFVDELDNLLYADDESVNLQFDWTNPANFGGDPWRVKRTANTDDWVQWQRPNITGFTVRTHVEGTSFSGRFAFEVSPNGASWSPVAVVTDPPVQTGGWSAVTFRPAGSLPGGTRYLRVHLKNDTAIYAPQLGQVRIDFVQP